MALHPMERGATKHCDHSAMLLALHMHCRHISAVKQSTLVWAMVQRLELSEDIKDAPVKQHKKGKSYAQLAPMFEVSHSTAHCVVSRWKTTGNMLNMPGVGWPQKLSDRAKAKLTHAATANPMATRQDLLDSLGKAAPKVCLNTVTRALRSNEEFTRDHLEDSEGDWRKVIWSDEMKIELFGHNTTTVWHWTERHISLATPSPQWSMVVGASCCGGYFSAQGPGCLARIRGTMNNALYKEILEGNLLQSARQLCLHRGFTFQQDNDLKHTATIIKKWFQDNNVTLLERPSQSPDLNPVENLWAEPNKHVHARRPQKLDELESYCLEEWGNIPQATCANAAVNYKKRLLEVIASEGHSINY